MRRSILWLLALTACACSRPAAPARRVPAPLPQVDGSLVLPGLSQPVTVVRDRWGIPHITAQNENDLFFAQGFIQAQDRLFQMDLWRRSSQGRLAQVLGPNFIDRDVMTARIQYHGDIDAE
ncbi:MAG TPA: penicillin acylase family protein, partial [Vicinamibacterales bacterium]|nr:penicillin acylase family protein [Vicinamibacterales bacterium]